VENIEFSGATVPDQNGAGIRLDGIGLNVRHCFFHDNENGILTSNPFAGDILIEYSEFAYNGYGDGFSHNLYVGHVNSLTFRYNYSHHAKVGHNLKSRANENYIYYNRIMDEETGYSSRLIDVSNGGFTIIMGNLLMQGVNAENNTLIGYGKEGLSNDSSQLYVINNTMVNKRVASCIFVDLQDGTDIADIQNNIFTGTGIPIKGNATATGGNIIDPVIANMYFVDEPNYNYNINSLSPAIDSGVIPDSVNGYSLVPDKSYVHPQGYKERSLENGKIDAGGYEYRISTSTRFPTENKIMAFPNPTSGYITLYAFNDPYSTNDPTNNHGGRRLVSPCESIETIQLIDLIGNTISTLYKTNSVDLSNLSPGVYILVAQLQDGDIFNKVVVRQ
jgi:hypothetical protein